MASRQIKMPVKDASDTEVEEAPSQRKRPETGRYLLQVDRQTKGSYKTSEAAQEAAVAIKKSDPIVQVSVYDSVEYTPTLVEGLHRLEAAKALGEKTIVGFRVDARKH